MKDLPPIPWDPTIKSAPLPPRGVTVQKTTIPGLLVIERNDPEVWREWERINQPRVIPPMRVEIKK